MYRYNDENFYHYETIKLFNFQKYLNNNNSKNLYGLTVYTTHFENSVSFQQSTVQSCAFFCNGVDDARIGSAYLKSHSFLSNGNGYNSDIINQNKYLLSFFKIRTLLPNNNIFFAPTATQLQPTFLISSSDFEPTHTQNTL